MARGVYGMRITGLEGVDHVLRPAEDSWPELEVRHSVGRRVLTEDHIGDTSAAYRLEATQADVRLDLTAMTVDFTTEEEYAEEAYLHPFLGLAAGAFSRWLGRDAFHAGAVEVGGRAWGVMGAREAGKSSLMAMLHLQGHGVLADDVCVVDGTRVLPGPASIDLRQGAAEHLGCGDDLGVVGARQRWRVRLAPDIRPAPLAGWVVPAWGDVEGVRHLPAAARVAHLFQNLGLTRAPKDPVRLLDLARLPVVEWRRPRDWASAEGSASRLARHLADC